MTNLERIRNMSAEELGDVFSNIAACVSNVIVCEECCLHGVKCFVGTRSEVDWLNGEADNNV